MPPNSDLLLEAENLGPLIRSHRVSVARRLSSFGVLFGLGSPFLLWGLWLITQGATLGIIITGFALLVLALPFWTTLRDVHCNGRVGHVCKDGFCYVDPYGKVFAARWDSIDALWVAPYADHVVIHIQTTEGTKMTIGDPWLEDYQGFVSSIEEGSARAKLPGIRSRLDKGAQVHFGPLTMTRTGLIKESYIFPIAELDEVGVEPEQDMPETGTPDATSPRRVRIVHKGRSFEWPDVTVADVSNFRAMMTVLEEHGKAREPYY